jgi:two-component system CheB/CheR fusion protein
MRVTSWNRWSENAWGLREEEVVGQLFGALDSGLPVQQIEPKIGHALIDGATSDVTLDAVDRRGRALKCRVRVAPLLYEDRSKQGAVILLEDRLSM